MVTRFATDGRKISLLGYGAMRLPTVDGGHANPWAGDASSTAIDQAHFNRQVKKMLDAGLNYFDTAPCYCRGESESALGKALKASGYARKDYVIATKLSNFSPSQYPLESAKAMFADSLKFLQTDYIDNYLLHSVGNGGMATFRKRFVDNGALAWCVKLREERKLRNLGFSFHGDPKVFEWCLEHHGEYHWDFCQIQMNYVDWHHAKTVSERNLDASYLYERLTALKIPVVVMEPLLGGRLARYNFALANVLRPLDPEATLAAWALRFCGSFDNVMTILSGMTYDEHIEENLKTCSSLRRLSQGEFAALERAASAFLKLKAIPCNSCDYCMPCPYGLDIPAILTFRNEVQASATPLKPQEILRRYAMRIPEPLRRAEHCTGCGRCLQHCPQQIDIAGEIAAIDEWIEEVKNAAL